ncbi:hypothetical protein NKK09_001455 [Escherichia coli]|uniref:Uncharacterized protein n=1 Tax=Escherichia coli TaxID=562 RepID=A0A768SH27_ECOLX|nr:hypothetical protein [Escherichia coli]MBZ4072134.1 hypothetical protein [Escherichia fergusonii]HDQ6498237.1 hypothetical protein [Escherichia coli Ou:H6]EFC7605943.1 hypothetical protein [Escherichia coli]EFC7707199.1 hypothetical protein [Escherichia coli]
MLLHSCSVRIVVEHVGDVQ